MFFPLRIIACVVLFASNLTVRAAVFGRQAALTDLPTAAPSTSASSSVPLHRSTVTTIVIVTPASKPSPVVSTFLETYTPSGQTSISTVTVALNPTLSASHGVSAPFASSVPQSAADEHKSDNKGAIAGGVLGALAVVVAAFAAFVWFRRRSPKHWRNRTAGRWQSFDNKNAINAHDHGSVYVGEPVYRAQGDIIQSNPNPLPPLHIRDQQPAVHPFGDVSGSPSSVQSHGRAGSVSKAGHHRRESSFARQFDVELQPKAAPGW